MPHSLSSFLSRSRLLSTGNIEKYILEFVMPIMSAHEETSTKLDQASWDLIPLYYINRGPATPFPPYFELQLCRGWYSRNGLGDPICFYLHPGGRHQNTSFLADPRCLVIGSKPQDVMRSRSKDRRKHPRKLWCDRELRLTTERTPAPRTTVVRVLQNVHTKDAHAEIFP